MVRNVLEDKLLCQSKSISAVCYESVTKYNACQLISEKKHFSQMNKYANVLEI
jgi:hypothetical protein